MDMAWLISATADCPSLWPELIGIIMPKAENPENYLPSNQPGNLSYPDFYVGALLFFSLSPWKTLPQDSSPL